MVLFNDKVNVNGEDFTSPAQILLIKLDGDGEVSNAWSLIQFPGLREELFTGTLQATFISKIGNLFYSIVGFSGEIKLIGDQQVTATGMGNEIFLVTSDSPQLIFYHHLSGTQSNSQVIIDELGNSYVIGSFNDILLLDNKKLFTSKLVSNLFILKFDNTGRLTWFIQGDGKGQITGKDIAFLKQSGKSPDLLVASGTFMDKVLLGSTTLENTNTWFTSWMGILTSDGNWIRAFSIMADPRSVLNTSQPDFLAIERIGTDSIGNIYTIGQMSGSFVFGDTILTIEPVGIFVAKWSPIGTLVWLRDILSKIPPNSELYPRLVTSSSGDTYVSGYSWNGVEFKSPQDIIKVTGSGTIDFFVAHMSPTGTWLENKLFPGVLDSPSNLIAIGGKKNNRLFAGGTNLVNSTRRDGFIARLE